MTSSSDLQAYLNSLPEWQDDMKARSMFASFSQPRDVNPEAWDSRFNFWKKVLLEATDRGLLSHSVFLLPEPLSELNKLFERNQITPLGISEVVKELLDRNILFLESSINHADRRSLGDRLLWGPLRSTLSWVFGSLSEQDLSKISGLLFVELMEKWSEKLVKHVESLHQSSHTSFTTLLTTSRLKTMITSLREKDNLGPIKSEHDVELLKTFMKSTGKMVVDGNVIRIRVSSDKGPISIGEDEKNMIMMQDASTKLAGYILDLEKRIYSIRNEVKSCLKSGDKASALHHLKRSKALEQMRAQRLSCLGTIEDILLKIENAHSDAEVFETYKVGERTLKSQLASLPSASAIDDLIGSIGEAVNEHDEISAAMAQPIDVMQVSSLEEDDDLLAELAALSLPSVPVSTSVSPVSAKAREREASSDSLSAQLEKMALKNTSSDSLKKVALTE